MPESRRGYVDLPSGQLHFRRWTAPEDAPLWILLHHSASDSRSLEHLGHALAMRGHAAIAFDTPGFGMSSPVETPAIARFAEAITEGLVLLNIAHISVFGHHTGASIALRIAAEAGELVDRAVLSGMLLPEPGDRARLAKALEPLPADSIGSHLMSAWERVSRYTPTASVEVLTREAVALLNAHAPQLVYEDVLRYDSRADLERVSVPVLVVCGEDEFLAESAPVAAALPYDGRWQIIPGAGLDMQESHSTQLADAMVAFEMDTRAESRGCT